MATEHDKVRALGKAIARALYRSTYNGERNVPCLSVDQEYAAGLAAVEAMNEWDRLRRLCQGD